LLLVLADGTGIISQRWRRRLGGGKQGRHQDEGSSQQYTRNALHKHSVFLAAIALRRRFQNSGTSSLRGARFNQKSADGPIQMGRFRGDVSCQLPSQVRVAAGRQLLCVSRDGGERGA